MHNIERCHRVVGLETGRALLQGKLVGRVFEWLLPQPVDDCLRVLSSCLLGGKNVTPLMCSTTETIGSSNADDGEDTVSRYQRLPLWCHPPIYAPFSQGPGWYIVLADLNSLKPLCVRNCCRHGLHDMTRR